MDINCHAAFCLRLLWPERSGSWALPSSIYGIESSQFTSDGMVTNSVLCNSSDGDRTNSVLCNTSDGDRISSVLCNTSGSCVVLMTTFLVTNNELNWIGGNLRNRVSWIYHCIHTPALHYMTICSQTFVCMYQQVLSLVTPKPTEVIRTSAFRFPDVNRSTDFLPREKKCDNKICRRFENHLCLFLNM